MHLLGFFLASGFSMGCTVAGVSSGAQRVLSERGGASCCPHMFADVCRH